MHLKGTRIPAFVLQVAHPEDDQPVLIQVRGIAVVEVHKVVLDHIGVCDCSIAHSDLQQQTEAYEGWPLTGAFAD